MSATFAVIIQKSKLKKNVKTARDRFPIGENSIPYILAKQHIEIMCAMFDDRVWVFLGGSKVFDH